jgi:hypothetical protein
MADDGRRRGHDDMRDSSALTFRFNGVMRLSKGLAFFLNILDPQQHEPIASSVSAGSRVSPPDGSEVHEPLSDAGAGLVVGAQHTPAEPRVQGR